MTAPTDLARLKPANAPTVVVLDEVHTYQSSEDAKAMVTAMSAEMRRRESALEAGPVPAPTGVKVLLRVFSLLFLAGAGFMIWADLTGYHP
jgi:hypothetical protein